MSELKCPYCGGKNIELMVDVPIYCRVDEENNRLILDKNYDSEELQDSMDKYAYCSDASGVCLDCHKMVYVGETFQGLELFKDP